MRHADAIEGRPGTADRARTLSYLFLAGAAIGAATLAFFPNPPGTDIAATWGCNGLAVAVGLTLLIGGKRTPGWAIPVGLALGTAIISLDIYFAGEIRTNDEMFYLWVAFFSFSFLRPRAAAIEMLILGASSGLVLALHSEPDATTRWTVTMGTLVIAGILIARLVAQLEAWVERSRQREVALLQAEERFRSTFEDAAVGMGVTDLDGRFVRVNDALARLLGYRHDELIGMHFADLTLEEEVGKAMQALSALVSGRLSVYQTEKRYRRADGELVWVSLSVSLVRDDAGAPLHLIGQMQDISDRKAAERELADRALHDPLTRLPNRVLFLDRVQVALARI